MLAEQFLSSVSPDLAVFLRERDCKTVKELTRHADNYRLAHPGKDLARRGRASPFGSGASAFAADRGFGHSYRRAPRYRNFGGSRGFGSSGSGEVSKNSLSGNGDVVTSDWGSRPGVSSRIPREVRRGGITRSDFQPQCWLCKGFGHLKKDCPNPKSACAAALVNISPSQSVWAAVRNNESAADVLVSGSVAVSCGESPLLQGLVNDTRVSVLRDSGANVAGVRKSLVMPDQFLDKTQAVRTFGGRVENYPVAVNFLADACEIVSQNLDEAEQKGKKYHDKKAVQRKFQVGDEVLVLLPSDSNKLLMMWKGPFPVVEVFRADYRIDMNGRRKVFHANMLKSSLLHQIDLAKGYWQIRVKEEDKPGSAGRLVGCPTGD
ncbi:hypothetical protein ACOMHN_059911 [Nucella lapillus]